ncbi:hypothetical protein H4R24_005364 [Coemansia sp. RSA 988]|nr:hypothetical protein H4R24_005364 [Coemansia sp. RSA 988]
MQVNPQVCVCAATTANPPTALEQWSEDSHKEYQQPPPPHAKLINAHYTIENERCVEPPHHPNAGIGGYQDVQCNSYIGGYYCIDREAEIGNDHNAGGRYWKCVPVKA